MTRTIVLAAPSQKLKQIVGISAGKRIYPRSHPVWEDQDLRREGAAEAKAAKRESSGETPEPAV